MQLSVATRNARADAVTAAVGNAGLVRIFSGAAPANCAAASTGTLLSEHTTGSPFAPAAASGILSPTLPANVNAAGSGDAGHFRVFKADGVTCVAQGTAGESGTEMILSNSTLVIGTPVQINSWTFTEAGA